MTGRILGILVVVAVAGIALVAVVELRTRSADPPYFAPTWLPEGLSLNPSAVVFTAMNGFRAEVDYGHDDGQGGLDRHLQLVRADGSPVDHPDAPEYASLSLIGERDGRAVWRHDGATRGDTFFGYVKTSDCGVATVSSKGLEQDQLVDSLLGARCRGPYIEVQPFASMRRLCRLPDDAPVWVMRLPASGAEQGLPYLQIYALQDDGCPLASNVIRSAGSTVTRERIAGRDTLLSLWEDGGTGDAYFRESGLTIVVYAFGGTDAAGGSKNQANLRQIVEGLKRVEVTTDGKIARTS